MIEYPKIETLFNRDKKTFKVIEDPREFRMPEFSAVGRWVVTEKIDGTNVRVNLSKDDRVTIGGRTDNAQMPVKLMQYLNEKFTSEKMRELQNEDSRRPVEITLFGEGYGAGIQKGGGYRDDQSFILFDVLINDRWWLEDDEVDIAADVLGIDRAPVLGVMFIQTIVDMTKEGFFTYAATHGKPCSAEGVVCRPTVPFFDRSGDRVMFKLKTKDFARD